MQKTIKTILITIGYVFVLNIASFLAIILFNEIIFENGSTNALIAEIIVLIIGIRLYFVFEKRVIKKREYNFKIFIIGFIIIWQIFWWAFAIWGIDPLSNILHEKFSHGLDVICGLEYVLFWLGMQIKFVLLFLIKGIIFIYNKLKKETK